MIPKATSVTLHLDRWGINMAREANIPVFQPESPVQAALDHKEIAQTPDLGDDLRYMKERGEQNPSQQVAGNFRNQVSEGLRRDNPTDFMTRGIRGIQDFQQRNRDDLQRPRTEEEVVGSMSPEEQTDHAEKVAAFAAFEDLVSRSLGPEAERKLSEVSKNLLGISRVDDVQFMQQRREQNPLQQVAGLDENISINEELIKTAQGGLIGMALGGRFEGRVRGDGHGMQDNVFMPIKEEGEQVATLAVSPKEYVVDAHTMSALGNGNADKGADVMDNVVENIREKAYGTDQQPNQINGLAALRPMMERV